jgi:hypothetical protein
MSTENAIRDTLESAAVPDCNLNPANIVDVVNYLAISTGKIANAISPGGAAPGKDAFGGHVSCLTEAVMGTTEGLMEIAGAIRELAHAVRGHSED